MIDRSGSKEKILRDMLAKKGIGPMASKSLSEEQCQLFEIYLEEDSLNLSTRATLLLALRMLTANEYEQSLLERIFSEKKYPMELSYLMEAGAQSHFEELVQLLLKHQDLGAVQAKEAIALLLDPKEKDYVKATFLEGERLKRETTVENCAFWEAFYERVAVQEEVQEPVLDFCNNYDGWNRSLNFSIFTALLFAENGQIVSLHGLDSVGPKYGYTLKSMLDRNQRLKDFIQEHPHIYYSDQSDFFPELYALKQLRHDMVKRPFLATVERLLQPIRSASGNHLIIGYTHKAYQKEFAVMAQQSGLCASALVLKGEEGSTQLPLNRSSEYATFKNGQIEYGSLAAHDFGIEAVEVPKMEKDGAAEVMALAHPKHVHHESLIRTVVYNYSAIEKLLFGRTSDTKVLIERAKDLMQRLSVL